MSARYNSIGSFSRITEVASRVTNPLPSSGNSAAFKEFAWRYTNVIAKALHALGRKPDYRQMQQHSNDIEPLFIEYALHWLGSKGPANWQTRMGQIKAAVNPRNTPHALKDRTRDSIAILQYVRETQLHDDVLEALASVFKYDRTYFDKTVSSLGPLLEKLTSGKVADLLSPNYLDLQDPRPIFDWMQVIRQGGIVYMGLDALTDAPVASAFGTSAFADLVSVAGHLYKHGTQAGLRDEQFVLPRVSLHCDEFSDLMGDEFVPMANKIGGAGFQLTVYTQSAADIEANASSKARANQVVDNLNTLVMLRVKSAETARLLTDQLPEVQITSTMMVSGVTDASADGTGVDFVSRNEDRVSKERVPLLYASDIMDLPKGQAFALMDGGHLWKVRMPLPDPTGDELLPDSIRDLADKMRRSYRTSEQWWVGADFATAVTPPGVTTAADRALPEGADADAGDADAAAAVTAATDGVDAATVGRDERMAEASV
jgi:conjugative coupling factor TraD (TOL family)